MKKDKSPLSRESQFTLILMGITCVLITVTGILFKQSFFRILPLYVSLIIGFLQSRVNRIAPLMGGINSLLYSLVYFYYGLYSSALYAVVISCPLQLITFARWKKRAYGHSVIFKVMNTKTRILTAAVCAAGWLILYAVMSAAGASYLLLDNTLTLFGVLVTILTMLAYIEYTYLAIPSGIVNIVLYAVMSADAPEQIPYLIFSVYSFICVTLALFRARKLYAEQQTQKAAV
ncbi:MAG: nicotinamide mononucleotide transporter [Ruminococcaceae bacterium]|nr:nicotinamide mononucleotide transporter [Oscillospiraceae bacterium]